VLRTISKHLVASTTLNDFTICLTRHTHLSASGTMIALSPFVRRIGRGQFKENVMFTALATIAGTSLLAQAIPSLIWYALVFFVIAIIAYVLGARGVAGMSAGIGRTLLFVFLVLAVIMVVLSLVRGA